ncbi:MAG: FAD-dependent oxidoreductase [Acidobacteriota bacterium]
MTTARVIGAGLSGLTTAWCLAEAGFDVQVVDGQFAPGGLIGTRHTPHGLVERAANAFIWNDTSARWFHELGIDPLFPTPRSRRRLIFRNGRTRRWPLGPVETSIGAARLAAAWISGSLRPREPESVAAWVDRVAGRAATRWLAGPALQGIYATPPERLAAAAIFGAIRRSGGGRRSFPQNEGGAGQRSTWRAKSSSTRGGRLAAPAGGMGEFIERLHGRLVARGVTFDFGRPATALDPSVPTALCTDAVSAASLLAPHAPALANAIASLSMTSLVTSTAFFAPQSTDIHAFGVLFPRGAGVDALGALFNTDIFAGRGDARSETWIYGADPPDSPIDASEIEARIVSDRAVLTGRTDKPLAVYSSAVGGQQWRGLPVYGPAILDIRSRLVDLPPWLALAGNYLGRLGVAKLLDVAQEAATRLRSGADRHQ